MIHNKRGIIIVTLTDVEIWVNVLVDFFVRVWFFAPQKSPPQAKTNYLGLFWSISREGLNQNDNHPPSAGGHFPETLPQPWIFQELFPNDYSRKLQYIYPWFCVISWT